MTSGARAAGDGPEDRRMNKTILHDVASDNQKRIEEISCVVINNDFMHKTPNDFRHFMTDTSRSMDQILDIGKSLRVTGQRA